MNNTSEMHIKHSEQPILYLFKWKSRIIFYVIFLKIVVYYYYYCYYYTFLQSIKQNNKNKLNPNHIYMSFEIRHLF